MEGGPVTGNEARNYREWPMESILHSCITEGITYE